MNRLAAFGVVAILAGLSACGSDDKSSSDVTAVSAVPLSSISDTSEPETSVTTDDTTETTAADSTSQTTDVTTAADDSTGSTDVDLSSRMDQARAALQDGDFTTMLQALELSGISSEIEDRQVTILAPTDNAFGDLSAAEVTDLLANPSQIDDLLKRHIIDELLTFDELSAKTSVKMLSGDTLPVTNDGGVVKVDGATVTEMDESVTADNGQDVAVFSIDRVLLDS